MTTEMCRAAAHEGGPRNQIAFKRSQHLDKAAPKNTSELVSPSEVSHVDPIVASGIAQDVTSRSFLQTT